MVFWKGVTSQLIDRIRSRHVRTVSCYWLKWLHQSVLSVEYLCVQNVFHQEEDRYSLSKPAVSLLYWCPCHHQLTDWLLDEHPPDWCDRQLVWCYNLLKHTHTPTHTRTPFHKGEPSTDSECEWWLYFHCNKTRDWLKTFRVGVYPTGQLASVVLCPLFVSTDLSKIKKDQTFILLLF